ncbi:MAG: hypothetical protein RL701_3079 [Pseudomonadota bacterium]|jgi:DNA-directed RNA polymerase subunit RPC12/RpoP
MPLKATPDKTGYCSRCRKDVRTIRPWPHWRKARYAYFGMLGVALFGAPVILADGFVLIPTLMVFIAAIGPLNSLIAKQPTCATCGAIVDKLRALRLVARNPAHDQPRDRRDERDQPPTHRDSP